MAFTKGKVSMELDDEDKLDLQLPPAVADDPDYPYGLRIVLTSRDMDKLGLEATCKRGDEIEMDITARVTGVFYSDTATGSETRVELQIVEIAPEEAEED